MRRRLIIISILFFWAVTLVWLIRFEAYPHLFSSTSHADYRKLMNNGPMLSDTWMKIIMQDVHVGYSHTSMDIDEKSPDKRFLFDNTTDMNINMLGKVQPVIIKVHSALDAFYKLTHFEFSMKSKQYKIALQANRLEGDLFTVNLSSPAGYQTFTTELPPDIVLYSPIMDLTLRNMQPGETTLMKTLDPATMRPMDIRIEAVHTEEIDWHGTNTETTLFKYSYSGTEMYTWMDSDGHVLRQQTPWGWTLEAAEPEEAVNYDYKGSAQLDMTASLAMPVSPAITDPRACKELILQLDGKNITAFDLNTHRQQAKRISTNQVQLTIRADTMPFSLDGQAIPPDVIPFLKSTMYIQSDHHKIRNTVRRIIGSETNHITIAKKLYHWVHNEMKKDPTISLPSALDVLKSMRGDCNEHTYLFTSLARAAGIPARVHVGVMYSQGAFYYHAWPAVYLNRWVEMDPTIGELTVDATHLSILVGELAEQVKLLNILGQTRAHILEQNYDSDIKTD